MFSTELLHNILSYSDNLRILKIKMKKRNMKYLFVNDKQLHEYLREKKSSFTPSLNECGYLSLIDILSDKSIKMENVFDSLFLEYKKWGIMINTEWYDGMLDNIINDYNDFYLNDNYYYHGYWYNNEWVKL